MTVARVKKSTRKAQVLVAFRGGKSQKKSEMQSRCAEFVSSMGDALERNSKSAGRERLRATGTRKVAAQWRIGGKLRRQFKVGFATVSQRAQARGRTGSKKDRFKAEEVPGGIRSKYSRGNHRPVTTAAITRGPKTCD